MKKSFARFFLFYVFISACAFVIGRLLPKHWFDPDRFPFRGFDFEKNGKFYEQLGIKKWQGRLPDMSRLFPQFMPPKNLQGAYADRLLLMIRETCVAECTHGVLCILGLHGLTLWDSPLRFHLTAFYILFLNLPYMMIQRYNRPRLCRLLERMQQRQVHAI